MDTVKAFYKIGLLVICSLLVVTLATPSTADVTYTYTGHPFTYILVTPPFTSVGTNITGSITFSSILPPDLLSEHVSYTSYEFSAGPFSWSSSSAHGTIEFSTNSFSAIIPPGKYT